MRNPRTWATTVRMLSIAAFSLLFAVLTAPAARAQTLKHDQGPNLGAFARGEVYVTLHASGGIGPYRFTLTDGALPPGMALRTDFPSWFPQGASAGLIGVATTPGSYDFTLQVEDLGNLSAPAVPQPYHMDIVAFSANVPWRLPDAFVGQAYSPYQLTAIDGTGATIPATWALANPDLPAGLILDDNGLLHITASSTIAPGSYSLSIGLTHEGQTIYRGYNLNVYDVRITNPRQLPNATQGEWYSETLHAEGGTAPYIFTSDQGMPFGLTLNPSGGLTGTPSRIGQATARFTVTDSRGVSYTTSLKLDTIGVPATLPTVSLYDLPDCTVGVFCSRGISVINGGKAPFSWSATGLPKGMSVRWGEGTMDDWPDVELTGTPMEIGTFTVQLTVTDADGVEAKSAWFPLRVSRLLYSWSQIAGTVNEQLSSSVSSLYVVGGQGPYSGEKVDALPAGLTFDGNTLTFSGTPLESGQFYPRVRFKDSAQPDAGMLEQDLSIWISGGPSSTILIDYTRDLGTIQVNKSFSYRLSACCVPSYAWSFVNDAQSPPPPGLSLSADGVLSGIPTVAGTYTFLVQAADATNPANVGIRQLTLTVSATAPPTITVGYTLPYGTVGTNYATPLTVAGGTAPLSISVAPDSYLPLGFDLTQDTTGAWNLTGTPTGAGQFVFRLVVTDASGSSNSRWLSVNIYPTGGGPPLTLSISTSTVPYTYGTTLFFLRATGGVPPYRYERTPEAQVVPGMRVQSGQPLPFGWTSDAGAYLGVLDRPGNYVTSIRVTDSAIPPHIFDRKLAFTVTPIVVVSQSTLPNASVGVPYDFTLNAFGGSGNLAWSIPAGNEPYMPPGVTLDASGRLHGSPTKAGYYSPTFKVTDEMGNEAWASPRLTVGAFAIDGGPVLPVGVVDAPYSYTLSAPGCGSPCVWSGSLRVPGLTFDADGTISGTPGTISGTPQAAVSTFFTVTAKGSNGVVVSKYLSLQILDKVLQLPSISTNGALGFATVGSYSAVPLMATGGTPPYTWSLVAGELPPGITLQGPGETLGAYLAPGVTYLAGRPMAWSDVNYSFTLAVTDAANKTATRDFTWTITPIAMGYSSLPVTPSGMSLIYDQPNYWQPLLASGGTNVFQKWEPLGPMPPGLGLDPVTGIVTGRPTNTGAFTVPIGVTDNAGHRTVQNITFNIAGSNGKTPLGFSTTNFGTVSAGVIASYDVTPTGGVPPYNVTADGLPAGFSVTPGSAPGSWVLNGATLTVGTYDITLTATDSKGNLGVRTAALTVTPAPEPPPCTYSVEPAASSVPQNGGSGSFRVVAGEGCAWTVTGLSPLVGTFNVNGSTGLVEYNVIATNNQFTTRPLYLNVINAVGAAVATHTITQFGKDCSFVISPSTLPAPPGGGQAWITITASSDTCAWSVADLAATVVNGTGSGTTLVTIPPNPGATTRTLTATVAGKTLTVTQSGADCAALALGTSGASFVGSGGQGLVAVYAPAGCSYDTTTGANWVSVTSGATGTGPTTLLFAVAPNSTTTLRTTTLNIGGKTFQVSQEGQACQVRLDLSGLPSLVGQSGATGTIGIATDVANCDWTVSSGDTWATVTPSTGTGNGTVTVAVVDNGAPAERTAALSVAGQTVNLRQAGTDCAYGLESSSGKVPAAGNTWEVGVNSSCGWGAVSNAPTWLSVTTSPSALSLTAQRNNTHDPRVGTVTIADQVYTVQQDGATCSYILTSTGTSVSKDGATGAFGFSTTTTGCTPLAVSYVGWANANTTFDNVTLRGTVQFSVDANPSGPTRLGTIQLGDQAFVLTQGAASCAFSLSAYGAAFGQPGGSASFLGSPSAVGCSPVTGTDQPGFISLDSPLGPVQNLFTQPYSVKPFSLIGPAATRIGHITFGGQVFTVKQTSQ